MNKDKWIGISGTDAPFEVQISLRRCGRYRHRAWGDGVWLSGLPVGHPLAANGLPSLPPAHP
jgi:hypothetical protein